MKSAILRVLLFSILVVYTTTFSAQTTSINLADSISNNFLRQSMIYPQEKLYVQIDKPYYITGEDIWFRAHLAEAQTLLPDSSSRYIYAELINPLDSVVNRVKIRPQSGAYHGHISLEEDLPEGEYLLRFYTRYMQGLGEDYFFKRTIRIGDPLTALYRTEFSFKYEDNNKKVNLELRFVDTDSNSSIRPEKIQIKDEKGNLKTIKQDEDDIVRLSLKAENNKLNNTLYIEYDYSGKFHKEFISIPKPDDFHVSFLPEGGNAPSGTRNRIAFKAINSNGLGEDISGIIVNEKGDTLSAFNSVHLGMGRLLFQSNNNEKYYAICRNKNNVEKRFEIPATTPTALALQADWQRERLFISLRKSFDTAITDSLFLVILCRGVVLSSSQWDNAKEYVTLNRDILPSGVIQILLVDANMNPVSERLVFNINKSNLAKVSFTTNKQNYGKREQIKSSLDLADIDNNPLMSNLSISVTDDNDVKPDTCINILSSMLLSSDLKGYIESPAYYFQDNQEAAIHLDLLMMTQGWSRYNISNVLKGDFDRPKGYLEMGQEISGMVKGGLLMNKPAVNYPVTLISIQHTLFDETVTDENGRFYFNRFELPDSSLFVVQGKTKKGGSRVELILDNETFPDGRFSLPASGKLNNFENYLEKADKQFVLANGMRMIYLKDVEVTAKSLVKKGKSPFSSSFNPRFTLEEIEKMHATNIFQILSRFAGVWVSGNKVTIRGSQGTPLILIDGLEFEHDFLENLSVEDIDEIEIIKDGTAAFFGTRGGNGVIMIATKRGEVNTKSKEVFNIKTIAPLGYQVTKEFYSPQYETKQQRDSSTPDLRTTIYWNPHVNVSDKGNASIDFYAADASASYSVVIEGVTSNGMLIYAKEKISRVD